LVVRHHTPLESEVTLPVREAAAIRYQRRFSPSDGGLLLFMQPSVAVMRDLSALMGSDVLVKSRERDLRPPVGHGGLIA
jgi:hypothetical protein